MPETTYYILQEFELARGRWRPRPPRQVPDRGVASRAVARLRAANKPALAFARTGDPETGEFSEAEVIAAFNVPPEFMGEAAEW